MLQSGTAPNRRAEKHFLLICYWLQDVNAKEVWFGIFSVVGFGETPQIALMHPFENAGLQGIPDEGCSVEVDRAIFSS